MTKSSHLIPLNKSIQHPNKFPSNKLNRRHQSMCQPWRVFPWRKEKSSRQSILTRLLPCLTQMPPIQNLRDSQLLKSPRNRLCQPHQQELQCTQKKSGLLPGKLHLISKTWKHASAILTIKLCISETRWSSKTQASAVSKSSISTKTR